MSSRPYRECVVKGIARAYAHLGDETKVQGQIDRIYTTYADNPDGVAFHMYGIGEEYYMMAEEATQKQESDLAKQYYQKAIAVWGRQLTELPDCDNVNFVYYLGISYQNIGQLDKAMEFYNKVITQWPDYEKAWDAQFMIVRICRNLKRDGELPETDANLIIRDGCTNVLQKYPQCPVAEIAQKWLEEVMVGP